LGKRSLLNEYFENNNLPKRVHVSESLLYSVKENGGEETESLSGNQYVYSRQGEVLIPWERIPSYMALEAILVISFKGGKSFFNTASGFRFKFRSRFQNMIPSRTRFPSEA